MQLAGLIGAGWAAWKFLIVKPLANNLAKCSKAIGENKTLCERHAERLEKEIEKLRAVFEKESFSIRNDTAPLLRMIVENQHAIEMIQESLKRLEEDGKDAKVERKEMSGKLDDVRDRVIEVEGDVKHLIKDK